MLLLMIIKSGIRSPQGFMIIESCHIENFGKLHDADICFDESLTVICRENGWGKSTLAAFIRAMLYGFSGERKRGLADERRRYAPWQGGAYGGSMVFIEKGKRYILTRVFGAKSALDTFELRDADTNLISDDFGPGVGEELFLIDKDSFERTAFIESSDCKTAPTDDVNALIGNITGESGDINNYEAADTLLKDLSNALSASRKTGKLTAMKDEITRLKMQVKAAEGIPKALDAVQDRIKKEEDAAGKCSEKLSLITKAQEEQAKRNDLRVKAARWRGLSENEENARMRAEEAAGAFPGAIPAAADIEKAENDLASLTATEEEIKAKGLTLKEEERLKRGARMSALDLAYFSTGVVLLILGVLIFGFTGNPLSFAFTAAGIVLLVLGMARVRSDAAYIGEILKKQERAQSLKAAYEEGLDAVRCFIKTYSKQEDKGDISSLRLALTNMRRDLKEYNAALEAYKKAGEKRSAFEKDCDAAAFEDIKEEDEASIYALQSEKNKIDKELEAIRKDLRQDSLAADRLWGEADEAAEMKELLLKKEKEYESLAKKLKNIKRARQYLGEAKEALNMRYAGPVLDNFKRRLSVFLKEGADDMCIDADLKVTRKEQGAQRDPEALSRGYQDMVGFCLRTAYADAMYKGPEKRSAPPLILDDPFISLDDENAAAGAALLKEISKEYQVIYLTCSKSRRGQLS